MHSTTGGVFRAVGLFRAVVTGPSKRGLFSGGGGLFRGLFRAGRECSSGMFFGEMFSGNVLWGNVLRECSSGEKWNVSLQLERTWIFTFPIKKTAKL